MSKYFYKGATLNMVFATPIPQSGNRKTITGYTFNATLKAGVTTYTLPVEVVDQYSFKLFLTESISSRLLAVDLLLVIEARKDNKVLIGRNTDLVCVNPENGLAVPDLDSEEAMTVIFGDGGELEFEFDLPTISTSPFEMWLETHPEGTQAQFLASILNPTYNGAVPEYSDSAGNKGEFAVDSTYLYVCFADNSWGTIAIGKSVLDAAPTTTPEPTTPEPTTEEGTTPEATTDEGTTPDGTTGE
jgi:hypothetical protein